jgi:hypothetical protein
MTFAAGQAKLQETITPLSRSVRGGRGLIPSFVTTIARGASDTRCGSAKARKGSAIELWPNFALPTQLTSHQSFEKIGERK